MNDELFPAGRWYVGDLCYVISHDEWSELCDLMHAMKNDDPHTPITDGEHTLKSGKRVWLHGTRWGDGTYPSNMETAHAVDSGTIGCILVSHIDSDKGKELFDLPHFDKLGAIFDIEQPFYPTYSQGLFTFGAVRDGNGQLLILTVDSDPPYDGEEDDDDDAEKT